MPRRRCLLTFASLALLTAIATGQAQPQRIVGSAGGSAALDPGASGARVVVMFFAATDCPISNRYVPTIERLDRAYAAKGVRLWWVYPNSTDNAKAIAQHRKDFSITGALYPGEPGAAVELAHPTVTPEAAVFVPVSGQMREVYRGRVDDRYLSIGQERPQATRHDLEVAIEAALAGKPAPQPGGPPVGCAIVPPQR
jgi:hypothetical protein